MPSPAGSIQNASHRLAPSSLRPCLAGLGAFPRQVHNPVFPIADPVQILPGPLQGILGDLLPRLPGLPVEFPDPLLQVRPPGPLEEAGGSGFRGAASQGRRQQTGAGMRIGSWELYCLQTLLKKSNPVSAGVA